MRGEFEDTEARDAPLARGAADEEPEQDLDHELLLAAQIEARESVILPGIPLN